jgi:pimeloyl-ACP methyl ester carboxylesterase
MPDGYSTTDVAVQGGTLRVGCWDSADVAAGAPVRRAVLALHGITATHVSWARVARLLADGNGVRVVAPDLRGRGRSNELPGPAGMPRHADDAAAAATELGLDRAEKLTVLGHSMGGFAAMVFAHRHPGLTTGIVLIDGGVPIPLPDGVTAEQAVQATLGPAAKRLRMTFPTREVYRDYWRAHPALAAHWNEDIAAYVDYDLIGTAPELRSSCVFEAIAQDSAQLGEDGSLLAAWDELEHPVSLLRAPCGLLGEPPGLYPPEVLDAWNDRVPALSWAEVPDTNHYTITLADPGAKAVADHVLGAATERTKGRVPGR